MKIEYKTKDLEKECNDIRAASRKYGANSAEMLMYCMKLLKSAPNSDLLLFYKPRNLHELKGFLSKSYAMNLEGGCRLVFSFRRDGRIEIVRIESIFDYHRG